MSFWWIESKQDDDKNFYILKMSFALKCYAIKRLIKIVLLGKILISVLAAMIVKHEFFLNSFFKVSF